ncbi:MAG: caspase domain-containing protein, partial [Bacteroidota bacterium]
MRIIALIFITLSSFGFYAQEKRLALVIGNANYDKGALQNPVNDALLMKKTLESLDFDVILDTNIATLAAFNEVVRKFGEKRDEYNVGFIYYAGHGVQLNDINYLLATKEEYKTEFDVEDKALSVQKIMRYLTSRTDEVNVLILDACRDNPFEQNWNPKARSTEGGRGLARIAPPTGSLIAYSTDAGNTAADGNGKNSI